MELEKLWPTRGELMMWDRVEAMSVEEVCKVITLRSKHRNCSCLPVTAAA